jgi:hypothetical protein
MCRADRVLLFCYTQGCFWGVENYFNKHFKDAILKSEVRVLRDFPASCLPLSAMRYSL